MKLLRAWRLPCEVKAASIETLAGEADDTFVPDGESNVGGQRIGDFFDRERPSSEESFSEFRDVTEFRIGCTAVQSASELGMQLGCRMNPAMGFWQYSLMIAAMPATVRPNTTRSTGLGSSSIACTCSMKTGALQKNSASELAMITSCISSVLVFSACWAIQVFMRASVSPPQHRNRIIPRLTSALDSTKSFHLSSVQMVTSQPSCSAMPRASATKG
mmetsp:Transcript_600/g.1405  ORF Transcript_600/g.1405 Transcript_600/m.1405 type:complete len:217 (-) Transcript_600:1217-1867(-)